MAVLAKRKAEVQVLANAMSDLSLLSDSIVIGYAKLERLALPGLRSKFSLIGDSADGGTASAGGDGVFSDQYGDAGCEGHHARPPRFSVDAVAVAVSGADADG